MIINIFIGLIIKWLLYIFVEYKKGETLKPHLFLNIYSDEKQNYDAGYGFPNNPAAFPSIFS
jgi:hypothetical protein